MPDNIQEEEPVTLTIKNVDPVWRELFNDACSINGKDRGDVINDLFRYYVGETYGHESADTMYEHTAESRAFRRARRERKKAERSIGEEFSGPAGMD